MNREQIYSTLFSWVSSRMSSCKTKSRRLQHWSDVAPADMPALFLAQGPQFQTQPKGAPTQWRLTGRFYLYAHSENIDLAPATLLNTMLDELEAAFAPVGFLQQQTFGLTSVDHCRIEGEIETDEGLLGDLAIAIVPFNIIATT